MYARTRACWFFGFRRIFSYRGFTITASSAYTEYNIIVVILTSEKKKYFRSNNTTEIY